MNLWQKIFLGITLLFFVVVNTWVLWEHYLGFYSFFLFILLVVVYCILFVYMLLELPRYLTTKSKSSLLLSGLTAVVLLTSFLFPGGIINFEKFEGEDYLVAGREGVANCFTLLKLKKDSTFTERVTCFGSEKTTGTYTLKGDTVFFNNAQYSRDEKSYYQFGIIEMDTAKAMGKNGDIILYKNYADTTGVNLFIDVIKLSP